MAFVVRWNATPSDAIDRGGIVVFDTTVHKIAGAFTVPSNLTPFGVSSGTSNIHLTPDGNSVLVEEFTWSSNTSSRDIMPPPTHL
jgi:hypothetical protein